MPRHILVGSLGWSDTAWRWATAERKGRTENGIDIVQTFCSFSYPWWRMNLSLCRSHLPTKNIRKGRWRHKFGFHLVQLLTTPEPGLASRIWIINSAIHAFTKTSVRFGQPSLDFVMLPRLPNCPIPREPKIVLAPWHISADLATRALLEDFLFMNSPIKPFPRWCYSTMPITLNQSSIFRLEVCD